MYMHVQYIYLYTSTYSTLLAFLMVWRLDYTVQILLSDFRATLKIHKKSNFDRNQLKLSTQHKYMYMYQKDVLNPLSLFLTPPNVSGYKPSTFPVLFTGDRVVTGGWYE